MGAQQVSVCPEPVSVSAPKGQRGSSTFTQLLRDPIAEALARALDLDCGMVAFPPGAEERREEGVCPAPGAQAPMEVLEILGMGVDLLGAEGFTVVRTGGEHWFLAPLFSGPERKGVCVLKGRRANPISTEEDKLIVRSLIGAMQHRLFGHSSPALAPKPDADLSVLSSGIVHSVRNPLTGISTIAELMRGRVGSNSYLRHCLDMILEEAEKVDLVMQDLLGYAASVKPCLAREDVYRLLRQAADALRPEFDLRGVEMNLIEPEERLMADTDAEVLGKLARLLMVNCLQGTPRGGRLTIHLSADRSQRPGRVAVRFADTGRGIAKGEELLAFAPFFKAEDRRMGLRLAAAKRLVETLCGEIRVLPGAGLEVVVAIPAVD